MQGTLDHRGALFGSFPAGQTTNAELFYTTRKLCDDERPNTPESVKEMGYFLLVDRGDCSFVNKVRNAQRDNAAAVIIADNHCICDENNVCKDDPTESCENEVPVMDDDGTGIDITIPAFMIYKPDAEILKAQLLQGTDIEISLSWPISKAIDGRTEFTLWTTPDDIMSYQFLSTFAEAAQELKDVAIFKPKMFIKDGTEKGCRYYSDSDNPCPGFCSHYGRYCPSRLYDFENYENKGTKMVVESIRRACIWEVYGKTTGLGIEWWNYMKAWIKDCSRSHYSDGCAKDIFEKVGIDGSLIDQCMEDSGNFRQDTENVLLDSFILEADEYDVTFAPAMYINGAVIRGVLTYANTLSAICASFEGGTVPGLCNTWKACEEECPPEATCILSESNTQCGIYEAESINKMVFDDDYIIEIEADDPKDVDTDDASGKATTLPTNFPVLQSTLSPTQQATPSPTKKVTVSTHEMPIASPRDTPSVRPNFAPSPQPTGGQFTFTSPSNRKPNGQETISESVQIYENRGSGRDTGLIIGLNVALATALIITSVCLFVMRDRKRQDDLRSANMEQRTLLTGENPFDDEEFFPSPRQPRRSRSSRRSRQFRYTDDDDYGDSKRRHRVKRFLRPKSGRRQFAPNLRLPTYLSDDESIVDSDVADMEGSSAMNNRNIQKGGRQVITRQRDRGGVPRDFIVADDDSLDDNDFDYQYS
jgi:hypothetical protein